MSRIGYAPVPVPDGVTIDINEKNFATVKGPKGELTQQFERGFEFKQEDGEVKIERPSEQKRHKSFHGLYRSLLFNMVQGVTEGYTIELELIGVGYRASNQGQVLEIMVGYSHPIVFSLPPEVKITTETEKGKPPLVRLESVDKQLVGQMAAKIRSMRKPEPYKGKGILYKGEQIRRKAGKTAASAA